MEQNETKPKFIVIELSKKQVDMQRPIHNDKNGKDYLRVFAPGNGTLLYPASSIKIKAENPDRIYFSRPEGTELQIRYSSRIEGVPDNAPDNEKYEYVNKTVKIEDLKAMYEEELREFIDKKSWVNMTVPTEWGKTITSSDGKEYVSVSIVIPEEKEDMYYSFIVPKERFKESTKEEGMSYFGFPKWDRNEDNKEYEVRLQSSKKLENGKFEKIEKSVTSSELKNYVTAAIERKNIKNMFVGTAISEKLVRYFTVEETGKKLASVSVPVFENETDEKATFYDIVVPEERIRNTEKEGQVYLSLFRNGPNGEPYNFVAKKSVPNPEAENGFDKVPLDMTSEEVVQHFNKSLSKYVEEHNAAEEQTLADKINQSNEKPQSPSFRRGRGR